MAQHTSAAAVDPGWSAAVAQAGRLQLGQSLPTLDRRDLRSGELATLDTRARVHQWQAGGPEPVWGEVSPAQVLVTNRRIVVNHDWRGGTSLWHVDVENLQLGRADGQWHLDLHPVGINPRVRLTGGSAPLIAVHVAHTVFPATWARLSGLLPLLDSAA